jgi:hypothetical protein
MAEGVNRSLRRLRSGGKVDSIFYRVVLGQGEALVGGEQVLVCLVCLGNGGRLGLVSLGGFVDDGHNSGYYDPNSALGVLGFDL